MKTRLLLTTLASAALLAGGCAVVPVDDPYYDAPMVRIAPPPPQYEYIGSPPVVGYVWIGGYWNWVGARYVWVPGRWEAPRPGYVWTPHRWERHGDHWRPYGGRWEPAHRPHIVSPEPILPPPRIEHRAPPPPAPILPPPRVEQRPVPPVAPPPMMRQEPPSRSERETRRPPEFDPGRMPGRHAEPPRVEPREPHPRERDTRRDNRRGWDRDGDGRPDFREGQRP